MKVDILDNWIPDGYKVTGVTGEYSYIERDVIEANYRVCFMKKDEEKSVPDSVIRDFLGIHSHYKKDVSHLNMIDVYRVAQLFGITDHCEFHAIKKILCAGQRGSKSAKQDIQEAIDSLNRRLQMIAEDEGKHVG